MKTDKHDIKKIETGPDEPLGLLEEYKELRAEIRHFLQRREQNIKFALLLTTATVGVSGQVDSLFLYPVALLAVTFLWFDESRRLQAIFRIATYIEIYIEPRASGLNWETVGGKHPMQRDFLSRVIANGIFPSLYLVLSILVIGESHLTLRIAISLTVLLAVVFGWVVQKSYHASKREVQLRIWKEINPL